MLPSASVFVRNVRWILGAWPPWGVVFRSRSRVVSQRALDVGCLATAGCGSLPKVAGVSGLAGSGRRVQLTGTPILGACSPCGEVFRPRSPGVNGLAGSGRRGPSGGHAGFGCPPTQGWS